MGWLEQREVLRRHVLRQRESLEKMAGQQRNNMELGSLGPQANPGEANSAILMPQIDQPDSDLNPLRQEGVKLPCK